LHSDNKNKVKNDNVSDSKINVKKGTVTNPPDDSIWNIREFKYININDSCISTTFPKGGFTFCAPAQMHAYNIGNTPMLTAVGSQVALMFVPNKDFVLNASLIISVIVKEKSCNRNKSISQIVEKEVDITIKKEGKVLMDGKSIMTSDNKQAFVRKYNNMKTYYALAYIEESMYYVLIDITTQDKGDFIKGFPKFESIVKSYTNMSMD